MIKLRLIDSPTVVIKVLGWVREEKTGITMAIGIDSSGYVDTYAMTNLKGAENFKEL